MFYPASPNVNIYYSTIIKNRKLKRAQMLLTDVFLVFHDAALHYVIESPESLLTCDNPFRSLPTVHDLDAFGSHFVKPP